MGIYDFVEKKMLSGLNNALSKRILNKNENITHLFNLTCLFIFQRNSGFLQKIDLDRNGEIISERKISQGQDFRVMQNKQHIVILTSRYMNLYDIAMDKIVKSVFLDYYCGISMVTNDYQALCYHENKLNCWGFGYGYPNRQTMYFGAVDMDPVSDVDYQRLEFKIMKFLCLQLPGNIVHDIWNNYL